MPNHVVHFAIHADDVERARTFYEGVFGWSFHAWGPPGFYMIATGSDEDPGVRGALQQRQEALLPDQGISAYECTVGVEDLAAITSSVEKHGGTVVMPATEIPTVGTMIKFRDTEGNLACAMQYAAGVA